ncbi:MAG: hypothetical protein AAGD96_29350, partial [Chloroflexota bacterium]
MFKRGTPQLILALLSMSLVLILSVFAVSGQSEPELVLYDPDVHLAEFVEVKFVDGSGVRLRENELTDFGRGPINQALKQSDLLANGNWSRLSSVSEENLADLRINPNTRQLDATLPDLNLYYRLFLTDGMTPDQAIEALRPLDIVEAAYAVPKPGPESLPPDFVTLNDSNEDDIWGNMYQWYADAAPDGIDARYAWEGNSGTGNGIKVC